MFVGVLRHNHKGLRPRSYPSYAKALARLDAVAQLTDSAGRPLKFASTHRLRHTKATEMIDAGVPIHVVQRYFGHVSPEMLMRYTATTAARAEHEFLKA
ncbi:tyrosine-type recombinase/integrase [Austwickia chelonae]|uniref:tyrosine-type recombinase/integrase n=1 Tax=Austwickia chelonae TaxID=100225 RepID=UPI00138ABFE7|nr:tyrosine-type recombinase/integrase [Austwickia chelonae]